LRPSHLSSTIASTTRQQHHIATLLSASTIYDFNGK
jgi:hypothetical protein